MPFKFWKNSQCTGISVIFIYLPALGTELNFYCCCINSRLLIFSTANKNLYKKNRGLATFYEVLQQPPRKFKKNCLFSIIYQYREQSGYKKQTAAWKQDVSIPLIICRKTAPAGRPYFPLSGGRKSCRERFWAERKRRLARHRSGVYHTESK